MLTLVIFLANFDSNCLKSIVFWERYFFHSHKYNITFRYIIHKPNVRQSKFGKTYRVSWLKPKEHPFKISALDICLGVTMSSRDADSKQLCSSG